MQTPMQEIVNFYSSVAEYMLFEYKPKYYEYFVDDDNTDSMIELCSKYYFGGNNIPDTAGDIVNRYLKNNA
jgi:hypothetical protein